MITSLKHGYLQVLVRGKVTDSDFGKPSSTVMCAERASTNTPGNLAISWNFSTALLLEEWQKTLITLTSPRTVTITGEKKKEK